MTLNKLKEYAILPVAAVVTGAYFAVSVVGILIYCAVYAITPKDKLVGCEWCAAKDDEKHEDWCQDK